MALGEGRVDWLTDPSTSSEEKLEYFKSLEPVEVSGPPAAEDPGAEWIQDDGPAGGYKLEEDSYGELHDIPAGQELIHQVTRFCSCSPGIGQIDEAIVWHHYTLEEHP